MLPSVCEAEKILEEGEKLNPGPWKAHSYVVARCARKVAEKCAGMDPEKAYILGLLHDMGRRYGVTYMAHVTDGYRYLCDLGYDEAAKVSLTHSFAEGGITGYVGKKDIPRETYQWLENYLEETEYDDYDRLIQLCDSLALPDGPVELEIRMNDVKSRYGFYPEGKWNKNFELKKYFEQKMGEDLYQVLEIETGEK